MPASPEATTAILGAAVFDLSTTTDEARGLPTDRLEGVILDLGAYARRLAKIIETLRTERERRTP